VWLRQGFTAGYFHQLTTKFRHTGHHCIYVHLCATEKRVFGVAIGASKRTAREADKRARQPRPGRFTLHREIYLRNLQANWFTGLGRYAHGILSGFYSYSGSSSTALNSFRRLRSALVSTSCTPLSSFDAI